MDVASVCVYIYLLLSSTIAISGYREMIEVKSKERGAQLNDTRENERI